MPVVFEDHAGVRIIVGRIVRGSPLTTVPIGGIDKDNLPRVLAQGAVNYCVLRAVNLAPDPRAAILELQETWRHHYPARKQEV